jgi:hypothetical protein
LQGLSQIWSGTSPIVSGAVVVQNGIVSCVGGCAVPPGAVVYNFAGTAAATPGLIAVGVNVGNQEVDQEPTTWDGKAPASLANDALFACDGAALHLFEGRHPKLALGAGVLSTVLFPQSEGPVVGQASFIANMGDLFEGDALLAQVRAISLVSFFFLNC